MNTEIVAQKIVELGKLSLLFGRTNRATFHEDGATPESDTDHTVMLGLCACAFASAYAPHLDIGKIAQYAFIHDLVEVYAGDTPSLGISADAKKIKEEKEHSAFLKIKEEFGSVFPWIHTTIEEYENLKNEESTFIKTFDKIMPKITQVLNRGVQFKKTGKTKKDLVLIHQKQVSELSTSYAKSHPLALDILRELIKSSERTL